MFLVLFLCLLALERRPRPAPSWPASALALPAALWCAGLILLVGDGGRVLAPSRLAFMIAGLLASVVLARAMRHEGFAERAHWFQRAGLMLLVLTFAGMTLDRPDHMLKRSLIHLANAFRIGNWGSGWALAGGLALASPALGRVPHFRFVVFGVVGYLLVTFDLAYFGFWRSGWFDSGNRMLTHVLPTIVWLLSLKAATIVPCPPRRDPGPSEHR